MTIQDLMNKRATAWTAAKDFVTNHTNENGLMSAEDRETYDKMEKEISDYSQEIARMQRQEEIDKEMAKATSAPITEKPVKTDVEDEEKPRTFRGNRAYKDAMMNALRSNFRNVSNVLQEGVDADGGYLVPEELDKKLVEKMKELNVFRQFAELITTSGERKINIADTEPAAAWIDEGGAMTFSDATFKQINLDAFKLQVAIKVTEELLYDSVFPLEPYIIKKFSEALSNAEEDAFLNGNGTGKPTGIFNATNGGHVAETITVSAGLKADNIIDLIYDLKRPYRKNAKFIMNDKTIGLIRKLKDSNGQFLWQPSLREKEPDRVFGYPVYTSPFCPQFEAGKSFIAFGDFSYYKIGDRGARSFKALTELFAGNGMIAFCAKERVDGKLVLPEAIQIMKAAGTSTSSGSGTGSGTGSTGTGSGGSTETT